FLHNEFIRAKVHGAKFRFGRPNCFFSAKNHEAVENRRKTRQTGLAGPCLRVFFFVENSEIFFKNFAQPLSGEKTCPVDSMQTLKHRCSNSHVRKR
ncbi:MAG: hypothetical protein FWF77_02265, partial [Defluviitaleaceae bacterium]|nr:hypothetical protein [Defluviitaleaceae bacterium]